MNKKLLQTLFVESINPASKAIFLSTVGVVILAILFKFKLTLMHTLVIPSLTGLVYTMYALNTKVKAYQNAHSET